MGNTVVNESVIEILSSKMGISSSGFNLKESILNRK
jgi:hypothetical protein